MKKKRKQNKNEQTNKTEQEINYVIPNIWLREQYQLDML